MKTHFVLVFAIWNEIETGYRSMNVIQCVYCVLHTVWWILFIYSLFRFDFEMIAIIFVHFISVVGTSKNVLCRLCMLCIVLASTTKHKHLTAPLFRLNCFFSFLVVGFLSLLLRAVCACCWLGCFFLCLFSFVVVVVVVFFSVEFFVDFRYSNGKPLAILNSIHIFQIIVVCGAQKLCAHWYA